MDVYPIEIQTQTTQKGNSGVNFQHAQITMRYFISTTFYLQAYSLCRVRSADEECTMLAPYKRYNLHVIFPGFQGQYLDTICRLLAGRGYYRQYAPIKYAQLDVFDFAGFPTNLATSCLSWAATVIALRCDVLPSHRPARKYLFLLCAETFYRHPTPPGVSRCQDLLT